MIALSNVTKQFGSRILFHPISLTINPGEKIGLLGPNGAGKTTLFSIILGDSEPSAGSVYIRKKVRIGYLPQESRFHSEHTILDELTEGDRHVRELRREKQKLEIDNQAASQRYGDILHELEVLGYFELEHRAKRVLMGLGFREQDFSRRINELSGGWQMRTLLAKLLTIHYDILLLDEPTNYLDLNAALWLKDYLVTFHGTFIMISHDKAFLNEVTNYTLILENQMIYKVEGNYEHYEQIREQQRVTLLKQYKEQEKRRKQLETFIARFHAQPNKAQAVRAKRRFLERMDCVALPPAVRDSIRSFHFPETKRSGYRVMQLRTIAKSYGDLRVYKDFNFEITRGEKAVLAGENGAGKSTLLKILAGVLPIDAGERVVGHRVTTGYFSQTRMDVLHPNNTVLDEACTTASGEIRQETIRTILGAFLFSGDDIDKNVTVLSGGEKSRLILAKLLLSPPNFLLLDEPTTHLDVDAVDALIHALREYQGTLVCISHDIHFVRSLANVVYHVESGCVRKFPGAFDYYLDKRGRGEVSVDEKPVIHHAPKQKDNLVNSQESIRKEKQKKDKERKAHKQNINEQIATLQRERDKLNVEHYAKTRALQTPRTYRDHDSMQEYVYRIQEIEQRQAAISKEIKRLRTAKKKI